MSERSCNKGSIRRKNSLHRYSQVPCLIFMSSRRDGFEFPPLFFPPQRKRMSPVSVWEFVKTLDAATPAEVGPFRAQRCLIKGRVPPSNCPDLRGLCAGVCGHPRSEKWGGLRRAPRSPAGSTAAVRTAMAP